MDKNHIGYLIKMITDKVKIKADADLKKHNLTLAQSRVLIYLNIRGGQSTQKEIECHLSVSHPTVVGIISRLEQNGFVHTWLDPNDKRNKIVQITDNAIIIAEEMKNKILELEDTMLLSLTDSQKNQLESYLKIILKNLD